MGPLFSRRSGNESMQNTDLANSEAFSNPFVHSRERQRSKCILAGGAGEALLGSGQTTQPSQHPLNARPHESQTLRKQESWRGDKLIDRRRGYDGERRKAQLVRNGRLPQKDRMTEVQVYIKQEGEEPQTQELSLTPWDAVSLSSTGCELQKNLNRCII